MTGYVRLFTNIYIFIILIVVYVLNSATALFPVNNMHGKSETVNQLAKSL